MKKKKLLLLTALAALLCPVAAVLAQRHAQTAEATPARHLQQGIEVDWEPEPAPQNLPKTYWAPDQYCLDSIRYWIGTGSKRAGLILRMDQVRVIGFRFDGEPTGADMLMALAAADHRFQMAIHGGAVLMMGWDTNENGKLEMIADGKTDDDGESTMPGVILWGTYNVRNPHAAEPEDYCWGGWSGNYWHYQTKDPGGKMAMSNLGAGNRKLQDGSWDEWDGVGLIGDVDLLYIDKPLDFSKLQSEFDYCGARYKAVGADYMKEVVATGVAAGYSGAMHIGRSAKAGEYA